MVKKVVKILGEDGMQGRVEKSQLVTFEEEVHGDQGVEAIVSEPSAEANEVG